MSVITRKIILILLSLFFLLSSVGAINVIDYQWVANFFGMSDSAQASNATYILILGIILIVTSLITLIADLIGQRGKNISNTSKKVSRSLSEYLHGLKNTGIKTITGLILTLILQQFFLKIEVFKCTIIYNTDDPLGGWAKVCGTEKELVFLAVAMILFVFAITPKNIGKKINQTL
ncbi:MAG: hypothetical protein WC465_02090 [Patescibacteria group bacterium]